jgi:hypothetical protein
VPRFMERPNPESAATITASIVKSHVGLVDDRPGQFANLACVEIDGSETGAKRDDGATTLAQANGRDLLLHRPGLAGGRNWIEAVDRWAFDIHPIEDIVHRTPYGGLTEQGFCGENAFDLWQL